MARKVHLMLASGKTVSIDRRSQKLETAKTFPFPQGEVRTPEGIGFIRIKSFDDPAHEMSAVRRVKELSAAKALIIDVRGNGRVESNPIDINPARP